MLDESGDAIDVRLVNQDAVDDVTGQADAVDGAWAGVELSVKRLDHVVSTAGDADITRRQLL